MVLTVTSLNYTAYTLLLLSWLAERMRLHLLLIYVMFTLKLPPEGFLWYSREKMTSRKRERLSMHSGTTHCMKSCFITHIRISGNFSPRAQSLVKKTLTKTNPFLDSPKKMHPEQMCCPDAEGREFHDI